MGEGTAALILGATVALLIDRPHLGDDPLAQLLIGRVHLGQGSPAPLLLETSAPLPLGGHRLGEGPTAPLLLVPTTPFLFLAREPLGLLDRPLELVRFCLLGIPLALLLGEEGLAGCEEGEHLVFRPPEPRRVLRFSFGGGPPWPPSNLNDFGAIP